VRHARTAASRGGDAADDAPANDRRKPRLRPVGRSPNLRETRENPGSSRANSREKPGSSRANSRANNREKPGSP